MPLGPQCADRQLKLTSSAQAIEGAISTIQQNITAIQNNDGGNDSDTAALQAACVVLQAQADTLTTIAAGMGVVGDKNNS